MGQPGGEYVRLSVIGGRGDGWTERIEGSRAELGAGGGSRRARAAATRQPRQVCSVPFRPFSTYLVRPAGSGKRSRTAVPMAVADDNCAQRVDEELCNTGIECWCAIPPVVTLLVSINTHEDMRPALSVALHC